MGEFTTIMARDGHEFQAWLCAAPGRPRGALVVLQEIFGVNSHIRAVADGFAAAGYTVIAPSLFDRIRRGIQLGYTPAEMQEGAGYRSQLKLETTLKDVAAAVAVVQELRARRHRGLLLGWHPVLPGGRAAAGGGRGGVLRARDGLPGAEATLSGAVPLRRRRTRASRWPKWSRRGRLRATRRWCMSTKVPVTASAATSGTATSRRRLRWRARARSSFSTATSRATRPTMSKT